jgi:hypothetical protein
MQPTKAECGYSGAFGVEKKFASPAWTNTQLANHALWGSPMKNLNSNSKNHYIEPEKIKCKIKQYRQTGQKPWKNRPSNTFQGSALAKQGNPIIT